MIPLDYSRSFLLGTWPKNEVRFWVESRTRILDEGTGYSETFLQCASCKSEHTFAERDLFHEDNYDFIPIFGPENGVIFRRKASKTDEYRSLMRSDEMWGGVRHHLVDAADTRELVTAEAILEAAHAFHPIVGQTEIANEQTGLRSVVEYPVKTLNTRRSPTAWQIDTGPVPFPDLAADTGRHADRISLGFVACNAPHFADFILEDLVEVGKGLQVHHYARRISLPATNRLFSVVA